MLQKTELSPRRRRKSSPASQRRDVNDALCPLIERLQLGPQSYRDLVRRYRQEGL